MIISTELVGIAGILLAQVKLIFDNKVTKVELKNIVKRLDKQNNRIEKGENWQLEHVTKGHKK